MREAVVLDVSGRPAGRGTAADLERTGVRAGAPADRRIKTL